MGLGLRALSRLAGTDLLDRIGLRDPAERLLYRATRNGFQAANAAGRTFKAAQKLGRARAAGARDRAPARST